MKRVAQALTAAAEIYGMEMTQIRMEGYLAALEDCKPDDIVIAITGLIKTCKFFPKPAEIIEAVRKEDGWNYYDARHPKWDQLPARNKKQDTPEMIENQKRVNEYVAQISQEFREKMGWK